MAKPFLSVIVPNYPRTEVLPLTLIDIDRHLSKQEYSYEIIVVNGQGSEKVGELIQNIKFIESKDEAGVGPLIKQGIFMAKGNWRVIVNPKNNVPVSEFNKVLTHLSDDYEIFAGVILPKASWMPNLFIGLNFLCFSETASSQIFPLIKTDNYAFVYEALTIAKKVFAYKIKKLTTVRGRKKGFSFRPKALLHFLWEFIKIRWRIIRKQYAISNQGQ